MTSPPAPPPDFDGAFLTGNERTEPWSRASGPFRMTPAAVARPAHPDDVALLVAWARAEGRPLVPRGAGTGMPGHNVGRGVVLELGEPFATVGPVDREARTVRVGPGAVADDVAAAARRAGLAFPPLPSSSDRCTIGGMVANNAAGARSFLHGSVREWVVELDAVLPDGRTVTLGAGRPLPEPLDGLHLELVGRLGREPAGWPEVRKNASGYALDRFLPSGDGAQLLVGSEGTLGVVTSVLLRLVPEPEERAVVLLGVPTLDDLPAVTSLAAEIGASACEYFGRRILEMAELADDPDVGPLARGADALALVELEGTAAEIEADLPRLRRLADALGTPTREARAEAERRRLWQLRHRASPTIAAAAERGLVSTQFIEDCVVPPSHLPDFVRGLHEILDDASTDAVVFGHAGDGNLHVNPLLDLESPAWRERVREILEGTVELVAGLGGTLSGEHGDGRVRAPFLERVWGPRLTGAFRRVKECMDPHALMNPGVVVPLPGQEPLDGLLAHPGEDGPR